MEHGTPWIRLQRVAASLGLDAIFAGILLRCSDSFSTACWVYNESRRTVEIHVNRGLCEELPEPQLKALILHELYHHLGYNQLHHLRFYPHHEAVNLAFDISLEWILAKGSCGPFLHELNKRLMLENLPGEDMLPEAKSLPLIVMADPPLKRMPESHVRAWRQIWWSRVPPSPEACYQHVFPLFKDMPESQGGQRVVASGNYGNETLWPHELPDPGDILPLPEPLREELRAGAGGNGGGAGTGSWLEQALIKPQEQATSRKASLKDWLSRQESRDRQSRCLTQVAGNLLNDSLRLPYLLRPTRTELMRQSCGWPNLVYHHNKEPLPCRPLGIYLDVSGSMKSRLGVVVDLIKALKDLLPVTLWAFDTRVKAIPAVEAINSRLFYGGGTDFDCVFAHALKQRCQDFVVFTDGESSLSQDMQKEARQKSLRPRAVLFGRRSATAGAWWWATFRWKD